ncbi:hypothetical protein [Phenylobacterium sp.]|uniref:hypothetical protein n=1 Tax=Phenylobacterium sp. TaxID=1871053 RepID=UPI0027368E22|nr:hypothetical protein [Phenylobacterium sp.]MDP3658593.1 hypothetical protein [Phenylobacterium sp.]
MRAPLDVDEAARAVEDGRNTDRWRNPPRITKDVLSMDSDLATDLQVAADEELERATQIEWSQLAESMPWGDTYEGFTPAGRTVCFERAYMWDSNMGGDIRLEVSVYEPKDYEHGVKVTVVIPSVKPT